MNKKIIAILVAIIAILGGSAASEQLGYGGYLIEDLTIESTTTGIVATNLPVKLLDRNDVSEYAVIENDSDAVIYIFPLGTPHSDNLIEMVDGFTSVTSTITSLDGIRIPVNGRYEITRDNLLIDEIWATTTGGLLKKINIIYK